MKGQFFNDLGWSVYEELPSLIYAESDSGSFLSFFLTRNGRETLVPESLFPKRYFRIHGVVAGILSMVT